MSNMPQIFHALYVPLNNQMLFWFPTLRFDLSNDFTQRKKDDFWSDVSLLTYSTLPSKQIQWPVSLSWPGHSPLTTSNKAFYFSLIPNSQYPFLQLKAFSLNNYSFFGPIKFQPSSVGKPSGYFIFIFFWSTKSRKNKSWLFLVLLGLWENMSLSETDLNPWGE